MSWEKKDAAWPKAAFQILSYLTRHPNATDTLEGIVEWWILRERIEQGVEETAQGLDFLVSQDLVIQEWTPEDWPRYRLNRKRLEEIEALVRDPDQKWRVA